jgi:His/Glu/Gln/Arg/opine family amino acid ABC transporter permease subunit
MTDKSKNIVYYDAPATRPAPVRQSGLIAWVRNNLLKTWSDVLLTIAFTLLVVTFFVSFITWTVRDANWWSVVFNFRQFMVGTFEADLEWRLALTAVVMVFIAGMSMAVWIKALARVSAVVVGVTLLLVWGLPLVVTGSVAVPPVYVMGGSKPVVAGNVNDVARPYTAFIGKSGEVVTVRKVATSTDEDLVRLAGFMDTATSGLRVVSQRRLEDLVTRASLEAELAAHAASAIPLFTPNQLAQKEAALGRLQPIDPVPQTLALGEGPLEVEILDSEGSSIGALQRLEAPADVAGFRLPADGWYILRIASPDAESLAVLSVDGMTPILQSNVLQAGGFVNSYTRMVDFTVLIQDLPRVDGREVPFFDIIRNQYWGARPLDSYLRLYIAPFLQYHALNLTILLAAGVAGYWATLLVERLRGRAAANRLATAALVTSPIFIWIMAAGLSVAEILNFSIVTGAVFFILFIRAAGAVLGLRLPGLGLFALGCALVWGMPYLVFRPHYGFGLLPLLNFFIIVPALLAFINGSRIYGEGAAEDNRRAFGLYLVLALTFTLVPAALVFSGTLNPNLPYTDWFLRPSDQRLWGGLMLTFMLTIFGIVASFPIGILLALGRRSALPAVSYGCTLYIELVRGSPFITVLFLAQLFIPLVDPSLANVPGTIRALVAVIMFSAAYLAENVRGGLQSLPPGQTEAGKALGLSGWQIIYFITLPQALRAVIPAILGSFISLFKDTSLVAIVGLNDLTRYVNVMAVQPAFTGTRAEGLMFVAIIYFVFSYVMSYVSRLLEASGSGAARRI